MAGPINYCTAAGCATRCHGAGLCLKHYRRWRRHGDVDTVLRVSVGPDVCEVVGCDRRGTIRRGMCTLHYQRWAKHGDATTVQARDYPVGPDHWAWVGDAAAYRTVHNRLDREHGPASEHPCGVCGEAARQWSYDYNDPDERTGVVSRGFEVPFSLKAEHYTPLCLPCHRRVDARHLTVLQVA